MSVSYDRLRVIMAKYKIKLGTLRKETGSTTTEIAKINKDVYVKLETAVKITKYISKIVGRRVRIEDLMEFKED
jgi:DNA-binding Xre family transcriptional regulator